jgi:hypothetical protein
MMISLRSPYARRVGFAVIAASVPTAVLFGLVAFVAPDSASMFTAWMIAILVYAALTTHRLVRWPTEDFADEPKSTLAIFISYRVTTAARLSAGSTITCWRHSKRSGCSWTWMTRSGARTTAG